VQPTGDLTTSSLMKLMFHMPHSIIRTSLREQVSSEFVPLRVLTRSGPVTVTRLRPTMNIETAAPPSEAVMQKNAARAAELA
jgi:hypothetical protein